MISKCKFNKKKGFTNFILPVHEQIFEKVGSLTKISYAIHHFREYSAM